MFFVSDLVSCKLGMSNRSSTRNHHHHHHHHQHNQPSTPGSYGGAGVGGSNQPSRYLSASHDSLATAYGTRAANVSSAASELDLSRKARRKDLRGRLKLPTGVSALAASSGEAPLLGGSAGGGWRTPGSTTGGGTNPPSSNHLNSTSSCNGTERYKKKSLQNSLPPNESFTNN